MRKSIWSLLAFLGRYGHQPIAALLQMPRADLTRLAEAVGDLIESEGHAGPLSAGED